MPTEETTTHSFEESLQQVHDMVTLLESGTLTLDESIETFRKASDLAMACQKMIAEAELRITELVQATAHDEAGSQSTAGT